MGRSRGAFCLRAGDWSMHIACLKPGAELLSHHQQLQQGTLRHCVLCHSPELTLRRRQRRKISRCPSLTWVSWIVRHELESPWIRTDVETCGLWSLRPGSERMMKVKCCRLESTSLLSLSSPWAASSSLLRWPAQTHASVACWAMMPVASTSGAKLAVDWPDVGTSRSFYSFEYLEQHLTHFTIWLMCN